MLETSARSVSAVCEACRGQADVNVDACPTPLRSPRSASGSAAAAATGSASRPGRMAHGPTSGRATLSPGTAVGAPTNGRDSSHLGGNSNHCRAPGPGRDPRSRSETTTRCGWGSRSRVWPKPASDWRERAGRQPGRLRTKPLLGLSATFGVCLAPPGPSKLLLARQRDERARHPALGPQLPRQHCRDAPGIEPATLAVGRRGPQPSREGWNDMWDA